MAQTTVSTDLLQPLEILTQLAVHAVGQHLRVLAVDDVALSVEEPRGDLVLRRVLDDCDDAFEFFGGDFTGTVVYGKRGSVHRSPFFCGGFEIALHYACGGVLGFSYRLLRSTSAFLHTKLE